MEDVSLSDFELSKKFLTASNYEPSNSLITYATNTNSTISVRGIKQDDGSDYCWACTAVSLGQYRKPNIVLNEKTIAIKYAGGLNVPRDISYSSMILSQEYGVATVRYNANPTFNTIKNRINSGDPILANISYNSGGGHSILLNGYSDYTSKYIVAMDPLSGTYRTLNTTSSGGNYYLAYVSPTGASGSIYRYLI